MMIYCRSIVIQNNLIQKLKLVLMMTIAYSSLIPKISIQSNENNVTVQILQLDKHLLCISIKIKDQPSKKDLNRHDPNKLSSQFLIKNQNFINLLKNPFIILKKVTRMTNNCIFDSAHLKKVLRHQNFSLELPKYLPFFMVIKNDIKVNGKHEKVVSKYCG